MTSPKCSGPERSHTLQAGNLDSTPQPIDTDENKFLRSASLAEIYISRKYRVSIARARLICQLAGLGASR